VSIDGKILARAKTRLEGIKREFQTERENRLREVYLKCPRIMALDREIKSTVIDVIGVALRKGQDPDDAIAELRDKNLYLQSERVQALMSAGFTPEYVDNEYLCVHCRDSGYVGTEICSCLKKLYNEELKASLSSLFKLGNESFENFDSALYDDTANNELGMPTRSYMESICETCYRYANKFSLKSTNLFFNGDTGLGKTFLSACVARVVAEKGFSVVYDMACSIFSAFEEEKFSKSDDPDSLRGEIRRYLESDLLIIDDLGTEMTTSFTVSALYELLNTRLIAGRKTIISSNLSFDELRRRYTPQILSRLEGEFQILKFFGRDIRLIKKSL
jgi:DNA replication protein DnaC